MPENFQRQFDACLQEAKAIVSAYRAEAPAGFDPQNVDFPAEWSPSNANYDEDEVDYNTGFMVVGGLIALSAFALVGYGAFYTYEAAVAAPAVPLTIVSIPFAVEGATGEVIGTGVMNFCTNGIVMTEAQQAFIASTTALQLGGVAPVTTGVVEILTSWGFTRIFTLEALLLLAGYNPSPLYRIWHGNFGSYLGSYVPGGGGFQVEPGFPGYGSNVIYPGVAGGRICIVLPTNELWCYWEY